MSAIRTVIVTGAKKKSVVQVADVGSAGPVGATGPAGPTGPAGASGAGGGTYVHTQSAPSTTWTVAHNLGYYPGGVSVIDSAGTKVYGDITHTNTNQLVINFTAGFSGKVYLS